jgi:ABC-type sugar transport system ATPase subunit
MNLFPPGTLHPSKLTGLRPEHLQIAAAGDGLAEVVDFVEPLGSETLVHLQLTRGDCSVIVRVPGFASWRTGAQVVLVPSRAHAVEFD